MGDKTGIAWTDATWNCFTGCTAVSPGCDRCYAASLASGRLAHLPAYEGLAAGGKFNGTVRLLPDRLDQPLRWKRPRRIFVNSMSDAFHEGVTDDYLARVFAVMAMATQHQFQILTKRHGRMRSLLNDDGFWKAVGSHGIPIALDGFGGKYPAAGAMPLTPDSVPMAWQCAQPLPNVWLGVSVEDQKRADLRIPALLDTPAAVRFLSCEPLLGPVDLAGPPDAHGHRARLTYWLTGRPGWGEPETETTGITTRPIEIGPRVDWVIVGGESGQGARRMDPDWVRQIRDHCAYAGVPFFFKQAGEVLAREWGCTDRKGHNPADWPEAFPQEFPAPEAA